MEKAYHVVGRGVNGLVYGVKERAGVYITDRAEDGTGFEDAREAQEFAEELTDLLERVGIRFESKEKEK